MRLPDRDLGGSVRLHPRADAMVHGAQQQPAPAFVRCGHLTPSPGRRHNVGADRLLHLEQGSSNQDVGVIADTAAVGFLQHCDAGIVADGNGANPDTGDKLAHDAAMAQI